VHGRMRRGLLALPLAAVLAGCAAGGTAAGGGDGHDAHGDGLAVADGARTIEVTASSFAYDPAEIEVAAGEEIAIELTAVDLEHDFVVDEVGVHVVAEPGETATGGLRIDEPGTYTAYCSVTGHRAQGMEATVTVTG
jgi:plastocyanin